eukprot:GHVS01040074.1.p1 GENE.GHVS01040074.1~~GHVS01040074.1.p1  ORF type:complete len:732 (+),score=81.88 GHVS01040074.1:43-2238(+)
MALDILAVFFLPLFSLFVLTSAIGSPNTYIIMAIKDSNVSNPYAAFRSQANGSKEVLLTRFRDKDEPGVIRINMEHLFVSMKNFPTNGRKSERVSVDGSDDSWRFDSGDNFFAWGGSQMGEMQIGMDSSHTQTIQVKRDMVYLARCDSQDTQVFEYSHSTFIEYLEKMHRLPARQTAVRLEIWLLALDPANNVLLTVPGDTHKIALDKEKKTREDLVRVAHVRLETAKKKLDKDSKADDVKEAVKALKELSQRKASCDVMDVEIWSQKTLAHVDPSKGGSAVKLTSPLYKNLDEKLARMKFWSLPDETLEKWYLSRLKRDHEELIELQWMWDKLYEHQAKGRDVYEARSVVLTTGRHVCYGINEVTNNEVVEFQFEVAFGKVYAKALKDKLEALTRYHLAHRLSNEGTPPQNEINKADVKLVEQMSAALKAVIEQDGANRKETESIIGRYSYIFGRTKVPGDIDMTSTDPSMMVKALRQAGWTAGVEYPKKVLKHLESSKTRLEEVLEDYTEAEKSLASGKLDELSDKVEHLLNGTASFIDWSSTKIRVQSELIAKFPQFLELSPPLSPTADAWYRLCFEALRKAIRKNQTLEEAQWELTILSDNVDKESQEFKANSSLEKVKMPVFALKYWKAQTRKPPPKTKQRTKAEPVVPSATEGIVVTEKEPERDVKEPERDVKASSEAAKIVNQVHRNVDSTKIFICSAVGICLTIEVAVFTCVVVFLRRHAYTL